MSTKFTVLLVDFHHNQPWRVWLWALKWFGIARVLWWSMEAFGDIFMREGCGRTTHAVHMAVMGMVRTVEVFQLQHQDRCPRDLDELRTAGTVSRIPKDPFDRPFVFECSEAGIRACSRGRDGVESEDDVCVERWAEKRPIRPEPAGASTLLMLPPGESIEGPSYADAPASFEAMWVDPATAIKKGR